MGLTNKLIELLSSYIDEYRKLKEEYKKLLTNQNLYEELLNALNGDNPEECKIFIPVLLNCIYGDNIYIDEYYNAYLQPNQKAALSQFTQKINRDYLKTKTEKEQLKKRLDRNYWLYNSSI